MKKNVAFFAVAVALCSTVVFAQGAPAPKPAPATPVQVTNTTTNPVPVIGVVNVSNLPVPSAFEPFYSGTQFDRDSLIQQHFVATVPTGKRLVIEHISYTHTAPTNESMIFGGLRAGEFGPILNVFQVNPPHKTAVATTVIQDASMPVRVYVDAGVDIWVAINSTADSGRVALYLQGHYEPL